MASDITNLVKKLRQQGFTVERTRNGHYGVRKGDSKIVYMPTTPSDSRGLHRVVAKLRRIGYEKD